MYRKCSVSEKGPEEIWFPFSSRGDFRIKTSLRNSASYVCWQRGTARVCCRALAVQQSIDRCVLAAGPTAANPLQWRAAADWWDEQTDRQTERQTDGRSIVSQTLPCRRIRDNNISLFYWLCKCTDLLLITYYYASTINIMPVTRTPTWCSSVCKTPVAGRLKINLEGNDSLLNMNKI